MQSKATTVDAYLAELPPEKHAVIAPLRQLILDNLPAGFEEGMQYGMIGYSVPHSIYPAGYHCNPRQPLPYASLAAQKNHYGLYLCAVYADNACDNERGDGGWFRQAWQSSGKKLDMGKGCVRFRKLDDVPLDVVAEAFRRISVADFVAQYEAARAAYKPTSRAEIQARAAARKA
ncbi:MAG: DUF1801 domain-containing protein [Xanthomonadales bacterium]|nr:DUF1801 domain-containing protein [Xanthomonadales bacterium]MCB1636026.1 DUF1801 domain-containing protein [Xanthomonadales bacterium]MCB1640697.1 DUF1801 domain-containing protein [Xanthomonadales bacterium]